jgi:hypothetical protein
VASWVVVCSRSRQGNKRDLANTTKTGGYVFPEDDCRLEVRKQVLVKTFNVAKNISLA